MTTRCKFAGAVTPAQAEVLKSLFELEAQLGPRVWKPKDLGAYRSSHHALTLKRLEGQGFVERIQLPSAKAQVRATFGYRITEAGKSIWKFLCELAQVPAHAIFGGPASRERIELLSKIAS